MIKQFKCCHSTTIDNGQNIRINGFKSSIESFRICKGTYFWNDEPENNIELLAMLATHWYELKRQQANRHDYPLQDTIYAVVSTEQKYVLDLTSNQIRVKLVKLSESLQQFSLDEKCNVYANYLQELEVKVKETFKDENFKFKVVLAIESIPTKVKSSKFLPFFIKEAKVLVVRDGCEELIDIEQEGFLAAY